MVYTCNTYFVHVIYSIFSGQYSYTCTIPVQHFSARVVKFKIRHIPVTCAADRKRRRIRRHSTARSSVLRDTQHPVVNWTGEDVPNTGNNNTS